jgi:hypothetical protein
MKNQFNLSTKEVIQWILNYVNEEGIVVADSNELDTYEAINLITKLHMETTTTIWNINITECVGTILIWGKAEKISNKF